MRLFLGNEKHTAVLMMVGEACFWRAFKQLILGVFTAQWNTDRPSESLIQMSAPCLHGTLSNLDMTGVFPGLLQKYLHALRFGLECGPEKWSETRAVLGVDLCTQTKQSVAHAWLVAEDGIHERSAAAMVSVVHSILNSLLSIMMQLQVGECTSD